LFFLVAQQAQPFAKIAKFLVAERFSFARIIILAKSKLFRNSQFIQETKRQAVKKRSFSYIFIL
jgi:hypothetical protein